MPVHLFHPHFDATTLAGITLWSLSLYLGFSPLSDRVMEQLVDWLDGVERRFDRSTDASSERPASEESMNPLYASLFSIVPFLLVGMVCSFGVELGLGRSWAISMGILACVGAGVYELGRRDGQASE